MRLEGCRNEADENTEKEENAAVGTVHTDFAAVFFLLAILESNQFLSAKNLLSILKFATFPGVLTIGLAFVILPGQIDLSCGMLMGLVSVLLAYFVLADIGVVWAVLLAVGIGTLCGLLNGVLTVCLKLPAFIVTIGTQQIFSGLAYRPTGRCSSRA